MDSSRDGTTAALFTPGDGPAGDDGSLDPGTRIHYFGDYEIRGELGKGAMGVVYKARQLSLNRSVALKMIRAGSLAGETELLRFQNEAQAVARLDHAHIVPIYEVGEHEGKRYFSMKLIAGPCLSRTLSAYTTNPRNAATLMITIAEAVHHAHQRGILHRDLKPSNILLDEQGQPHVSDFGLAKQLEDDGSLTESGAVLGTPAYMAPEQAAGRKTLITTLSDVYGLGAVLYSLLTAKPPFDGDSVLETLDQVRQQQPVPPSKLNPRVPKDLEIICLKCLEKDPERRYPSAQAVAAELRRFLEGEPIQARRASAIEKAWRWCRRRPLIAALSAAVVLAVLGGLVGTSLGLFAALNARQKEREQTELAEERLYDARMNLIQRDWDYYNGALLRQELDAQVPAFSGGADRRGFEWFYWHRRLLTGHFTLTENVKWPGYGPPPPWIAGVAFSPDGKRIAAASWDHTVKIWDLATRRPVRTFMGHTTAVRCVAFSPGGHTVASGSDDGTAKVWDAATARLIYDLKPRKRAFGAVWSVAFSPDGRTLASVGSGDDDLSSMSKTVKLWDAATGREINTLRGHAEQIHGLVFSNDGRTLVSVDYRGTVKVWDAATWREVRTIGGHTGWVICLALNPDGQTVAAGCADGSIKFWNAANGREIRTLPAHRDAVWGVTFSPDAKWLASASADQTAKIWETATGREVRTLKGHAGKVSCVAFSPDGRSLAAGDWDAAVKVWDTASDQETFTLKGGQPRSTTTAAYGVAFSPDGKWLAGGDGDLYKGTVKVWNAATGAETLTLSGLAGVVSSVTFSPDGRTLASVSWDATAKLWDAATGQLIRASSAKAVAFSPDSRRLASIAAQGGKVSVLDAPTGEEVLALKGEPDFPSSVAFSPDGKRLATFGADVKLWDAATGERLRVLNMDNGFMSGVSFSPDGKHVACASGDGTVKMWDTATGKETRSIKIQPYRSSIAFMPDGKRLATNCEDGTVKVWDASTGLETVTFKEGFSVGVAFSPDGYRLASACADGTVRIWDARPLDADPANPIPTSR